MLILHQISKIRKQIDNNPKDYLHNLELIKAIETEYKRGLPSKNLVGRLNAYALKAFLNYKGSKPQS